MSIVWAGPYPAQCPGGRERQRVRCCPSSSLPSTWGSAPCLRPPTPHSLFPEPRVPFGSGFGQRSLVAPYFFLCTLPAALTPLLAPELLCSKLQLSLCLIHLSRKLRLCPLNCCLLSNSWLSVLLLGLLALPLCHLHWVKYKNDSSSLNTLIASLRQW